MLKNIIITNRYFDSATLMLLTTKVKKELGLASDELAVMMATEMNKRIMRESGLLLEKGEAANPGDVLIAVKTDLEDEAVLELVQSLLAKKAKKSEEGVKAPTSVNEALEAHPESNFAVVSLPGVYAARETKKLLNAGKHVLLFSDNISIEDEVALKKLAVEKDLLMMGPDCGTAVINGVGLGFSNKIRRGRVGIVAASGTGLQEVSCLISNAGSGISQAFGTGGRDVKDKVGGIMMMYCLDLLEKDENTDVVVIVSKPPQQGVLAKLVERLDGYAKPVVACFLGAEESMFEGTKIKFAATLEEAARKAIELEGGRFAGEFDVEAAAEKLSAGRSGYIRALYCGGTLAYEALLMLEGAGLDVCSNLSKHEDKVLSASDESRVHSILDMGDDEFTVGRPHPMIDPSGRSARIRREALDPDVSVIVADVELGYGSNDEAFSILAEDVRAVREARPDVAFIAVICGSVDDYQGYEKTKAALEAEGAVVPPSNAAAVKLALRLLKK